MKLTIFLVSVFISFGVLAQSASERLLSINAQIDEAVVKKDTKKLARLYADDFVFTHGTGLVEGKTSWIKNVADGRSRARCVRAGFQPAPHVRLRSS